MKPFLLLLGLRLRSARNAVAFLTPWERARDAAFLCAGLALLAGLYAGFARIVAYLKGVPLIGELILWKLTAMLLLTTFTMVVISGLLTALTTLYFSYDLKFLMRAPLSCRAVFLDKSLESAFFASWMIGLVLMPYAAALARAGGYGWRLFAVFAALTPPFLLLAASAGIAFTLAVLYLFPTPRTRDVIWVLSSLSLTLLYGLARFSQPERLVRPDALRVVAEYLQYLQAPTARYLPSWWLTKALMGCSSGRLDVVLGFGALLCAAAAAVYAGLAALSGLLYFDGYSGAQEGGLRRRTLAFGPLREGALMWKERLSFFRDVKHWSQIMLVAGLVFVYLFSVRRLPLDNAELRGLVSFLNIGTGGFVLAALGLRFTFPSISMEGRSFWVLAAAPVSRRGLMRQKFLFSALPMTALAFVLAGATNHFLHADAFASVVSMGCLVVIGLTLCSMGVGLGAVFPMFHVENIHQVESSLGGFVYMASALFYVGANVVVLSWPVRMHFQRLFGRAEAWDPRLALVCGAAWLALNAGAFAVPWVMGARALDTLEV